MTPYTQTYSPSAFNTSELYRVNREIIFYLSYFNKWENKSYYTKVLELGCGRGNLTYDLFNTFKNDINTYSILDSDVELIGETLKKVNGFQTIMPIVINNDMNNNLNLDKNNYNLVVTSLSIHHVQNKEQLFKQIYNSLTNNGLFVIGDIFDSEDNNELNFVNFIRDTILQQQLVSDSDRNERDKHRKKESRESINQYINYLKKASFHKIYLLYKHINTSILIALKEQADEN